MATKRSKSSASGSARRPRGAPITIEDIKEFAQTHTDFGFEMKVLKALVSFRMSCEHNGTYRDPVTGVTRQFDIRALLNLGGHCAQFSVECKNINEGFPIVVHSVRRPLSEAFHEVLIGENVRVGGPPHTLMKWGPKWQTVRVSPPRTRYEPGLFVGKSIDQVGIRQDGGTPEGGDSRIFEKFSQAINSSVDLLERAASRYSSTMTCAVIPVVVVPDGRLWALQYDDDGHTIGDPQPVNSIPYFIGHTWERNVNGHLVYYTISHLEFFTLGGLSGLAGGNDGASDSKFFL